ncbi:MAG: hypothetical protein LBJ25_00965 [Candidatus Margulisbacteria bacterium]|jgi:hypothetical protein|nr:hypothetical protein [Candidatus Margulisiibacteriota bacterium]
MTTQEKTKPQATVKQPLRIVEKAVRAPAAESRKLENFKKLLVKNLKPRSRPENVVQAIVDAALVSEYTPQIRRRDYYPHMREVISNALLKNKILKKEALNISKHYQKRLG